MMHYNFAGNFSYIEKTLSLHQIYEEFSEIVKLFQLIILCLIIAE